MGPGHPRIKYFHHHFSLFFMAKSDARIHRRRSRQPKHVERNFEHLGKAHVTGVYVRAVMIPRAERIIPKGTPENKWGLSRKNCFMSAMVGAGQMHNGTKNHAARAATGRSCVPQCTEGKITRCGGRGNVFLAREGPSRGRLRYGRDSG